MGLFWTDFNCRSNICRGNICPGNICPYQEYLRCHKPDFDQTLKVGSCDHFEHIPTVTKISQQKFCWQKCSTKKNYNKKFSQKEILPPNFFANKKFSNKKYLPKINFHWNWDSWEKKDLPKKFTARKCFQLKKNSTKRISSRNFFLTKMYLLQK